MLTENAITNPSCMKKFTLLMQTIAYNSLIMKQVELGMPGIHDPAENDLRFDFSELKDHGGIDRVGELNPYVTLACDLRCGYCYMGDFLQTAKNTTELMPRRFLAEMIDTLIDDGQGLDRMTFLGGEPTLHPEITGMINDAAERDISQLRMTTNGVSLHNLDLSRMKEGAFDCVSVSIDGVNAEDNDATRGRGTFKRIIQTLTSYREAQVPLSINYTVTTRNIARLQQTAEFFHGLGAATINFHRASLNGTAYDNPELIVGPGEWVAARDGLLDHIKDNAQDYSGMSFRIPYTFLTAQQMVDLSYSPIQENNYHSPNGGHRLITLPPTPSGQGLCYMSSDLIGEANTELGRISPTGTFRWNEHPRNELTVYRDKGSATPNISTYITGQEQQAEPSEKGLVRVSHSFKAVVEC